MSVLVTRRSMTSRMSTTMSDPPRLDESAFDRLYDDVSNWGRWGSGDSRGTLNHLTPAMVTAAGALAQEGRTVSLAHELDTAVGPDNTKPALHYMTQRADLDDTEPRVNTDFLGIDFHGKSVTHLDALCHVNFRGNLYNAVDSAACVSSAGSTFGSVTTMSAGIVGRGVLLDIPRSRQQEWLEPGTAVLPNELATVAEEAGVAVDRGDLVLIRTGARRRREILGSWDPADFSAGLYPTSMRWLHERDIAVLGADGDSDARPSPVENIDSPIHALALSAMGMPLVDNMNLEQVAATCAEFQQWQFLCVLAPLRVPGGTGSPVNPIAVF